MSGFVLPDVSRVLLMPVFTAYPRVYWLHECYVIPAFSLSLVVLACA